MPTYESCLRTFSFDIQSQRHIEIHKVIMCTTKLGKEFHSVAPNWCHEIQYQTFNSIYPSCTPVSVLGFANHGFWIWLSANNSYGLQFPILFCEFVEKNGTRFWLTCSSSELELYQYFHHRAQEVDTVILTEELEWKTKISIFVFRYSLVDNKRMQSKF